MKKTLLKTCATFMALIMIITSFEAPYVLAAENEMKEDMAVEDLVAEDLTAEDLVTEDLTVEDLATEDATTEDLEQNDLAVEDLTTEKVLLEKIIIEDFTVEDFTVGDMELNISDDETITSEKDLTVEEVAVTITGEEPVLYGGEEAQIAVMSDETGSTLYTGTVSGYLSQSGDYALYAVELPAGSYLQARLTVPNNSEIDYDLVLYDSSLSVIKASDYITYLNGTGALAESIGYKVTSYEKVYIGVFSSFGGSNTEEYTLEFSITTNYSENGEPNENAKEAASLTFVNGLRTTVSGALNSAIDNDWYSFKVLDNPDYNKIRLDMDFTSKTNGYNIEIYRNLTSDYYAMQLVAAGSSGEIALPADTYFLRVVSTNTLSNFNAGDSPTYQLTVSPVGRVDFLEITKFSGYPGGMCEYNEGIHYRVGEVENTPNDIEVYARACYMIGNNTFCAKNVIINATVTDEQWEKIRPEWAKVHYTATTNANGFVEMHIFLNPACGGLWFSGSRYIHVYDYMQVDIATPSNTNAKDTDHFYYETLESLNQMK